MKKATKILAVSCLITTFWGIDNAEAAINLETETPVAGMAVAVNNYYAGSLNPEEELAKVLSTSDILVEATKSTTTNEAPMVQAAKSAYENVAISKVSNYVNVRSEPNTTSQVVGKIYNNCAATIVATVDGEGGKWYQIKSGTVNGYIKSEYFITGSEAEAKARQVGKSIAKVSNTATLRLREQPNMDSKTLDLLSADAEYVVLGEEGDFAKIAVDNDLVGYVYKDYIKIRVEFDQAVSVEEEKAKEEEAAMLKKEADDAIAKLNQLKAVESKKQTTTATTQAPTTVAPPKSTAAAKPSENSGGNTTIAANPNGSGQSSSGGTPPTAAATQAPTTAAPTTAEATKSPAVGPGGSSNGGSSAPSGEVTSATRSAIVAYARQFLGNPYVYGGTSLTNGADCSGFTQAIYAHFGVTTGRSSRDQAAKGREIAIGSVQPGDLLFYASGNYINHVAMYIGGGQVIHASNPTTGITISPSNYRTPCKAVSFLD